MTQQHRHSLLDANRPHTRFSDAGPMKVERRAPGPAYANLQWRKPREVWRGGASGDLTAVVPECQHNFCDMARTSRMGENTFRRPCNFKELRVVKKGTYCNFCVTCLMAAFVPH